MIAQPDGQSAGELLTAINRTCVNPSRLLATLAAHVPGHCECDSVGLPAPCCTVITSLAQLHALDLARFDVLICSESLEDGGALDVLAYIRGTRPQLPVVLVGVDPTMAVEAIRAGAADFILNTREGDLAIVPLAVEKCLVHERIRAENEQLHVELSRSLAELADANQQLHSVILQLEKMARTDELTGLFNRRWLNLTLQGNWADASRNSLPLGCMMIDLDDFKAVNDHSGHDRGDDLLRLVARIIRANCRQVDVPARYGGDEFCILMSHTEPHEAVIVAERIQREFVNAVRQWQPPSPRVSMSIGVAHNLLSRPVNAEQLVTHADEAMYAAKAAGKQRVMVRDANGIFAPMIR